MTANGQYDRFGWCWFLGISAFLVLGAASVWLGGLNQDEGWYLYAAQLVGEGKTPYRDFFYTQGPLMPVVYSAFAWTWRVGGLLGARLLTLAFGLLSLVFAVALARKLVPPEWRSAAGLACFLLLGCNLYHLYYLTIPKTYSLASVFVLMGFFLLTVAEDGRRWWLTGLAGLALALAAGTRISLGALLAVAGLNLLLSRRWRGLAWLCSGGLLGLALVYGPFLCDAGAREGLLAAQRYHAARGGFDLVWVVGSASRLVRWYLPVFVLLGLGVCARWWSVGAAGVSGPTDASVHGKRLLLPLYGFLAVFAVQMAAPFPYEDYQVPIMGLMAVVAVAVGVPAVAGRRWLMVLLALGMTWAGSFGSPLLEKWMTNGQDRFWSLKKTQCELAQLRAVARQVEALDPGGRELLTQDLYLAVECGRKVPKGLEMGPFAMLSDSEWRSLLGGSTCEIAALSGYSFAIVPPVCDERPISQQMEFWNLLKNNYKLVDRVENFGQNATTLMILRRK